MLRGSQGHALYLYFLSCRAHLHSKSRRIFTKHRSRCNPSKKKTRYLPMPRCARSDASWLLRSALCMTIGKGDCCKSLDYALHGNRGWMLRGSQGHALYLYFLSCRAHLHSKSRRIFTKHRSRCNPSKKKTRYLPMPRCARSDASWLLRSALCMTIGKGDCCQLLENCF